MTAVECPVADLPSFLYWHGATLFSFSGALASAYMRLLERKSGEISRAGTTRLRSLILSSTNEDVKINEVP